MISVHFQGKSFNITVFQVSDRTIDTKEAEADRFYEDLHEFLEVIQKKKNVFFIIEDWNAKVGSQEIPGVTGKFDPGVQNEAE